MFVLRNDKGDIIYAASDENRFSRHVAKLATVVGIKIDFVKPVAGAHS